MTKNVAKTLERIGLLSSVGLIAISASTFGSTSAMAAAPVNPYYQVSPDQQQWDKSHQNNQKSGQIPQQQNTQQNGQPQDQQGGQWQNGQPQYQPNGQTQYQQGSQWQNGQPQYQQNGQTQNQQWWMQQNGQPQYQQGGQWQNGQPQYQQNGQWQQDQQRHRYDWSAYQPGHRPEQWQQYHQDFNPRDYQWNRTAERRYYGQRYEQPRGWYYQRWVYGETLPAAFWGREYWLDSYSDFGLIDPPYGYVWVRYGNDALLVDVESGQILSVEYGMFYS